MSSLLIAGLENLRKLVLKGDNAVLSGSSASVLQSLIRHLTAVEFLAVHRFWDNWQGRLASGTLEKATLLSDLNKGQHVDPYLVRLPAVDCSQLQTVRDTPYQYVLVGFAAPNIKSSTGPASLKYCRTGELVSSMPVDYSIRKGGGQKKTDKEARVAGRR
jgi:hypothetical protein